MSVLLRLLLIAVAWVVIEIGSGYIAHRLPAAWFTRDRWLFRLRRWEADGAVYQRLFAVRRWKDRLPEAGAMFRGGVSKRLTGNRDAAALARLVGETRRAELTHWLPLPLSATFFLWNPLAIALWMPLFALLANAPFIIVQRYNRPRLERAAER